MNKIFVLPVIGLLFACPPKNNTIVYPDPVDNTVKVEPSTKPTTTSPTENITGDKVHLTNYTLEKERFEKTKNTIISDNLNNILWTKTDNSDGKFITWEAAKKAGYDMKFEKATEYCSNLVLEGYSNWRLPTLDEAQSLADAPVTTTIKPSKDATKDIQLPYDFSLTGYGIWTSQKTADNSEAMIVYLDGSGMQSAKISTAGEQIRALCTHDQNTPPNPVRKLMWATQDNGKGIRPLFSETSKYTIDWNEATKYCDDLVFADYTDWRLPTIGEARSLYQPELPGYNPISDLKQLIHIPVEIQLSGYGVWTSEVKGLSEAADVGMGNGRSYWHDKSNRSFIVRALCVRDTR